MAVNSETLAAVRDFFERFRYAGIILPNGWFGRPHDNMHELTKGAASASALVIELDGLHTLKFSGNTRAMASEQSLRISGFGMLAWDWVEAGEPVNHREEFDAGFVEFVPPRG